MEETLKILPGIAALLGAMVAFITARNHSTKSKLEILSRFASAISSENKYETQQLFFMLHRVRMKYKDILYLVNLEDSASILYIIQKRSSMIWFDSGKLKFRSIFKYNYVRKAFDYASIFLMIVMLTVVLISFFALLLAEQKYAIVSSLMLIFFGFFLLLQIRDFVFDKKAYELISKYSE
ncbi:hypothetical protein [Ketobacter alkanivorans]|uniref:Uncharacterized protein n=1 Tax=Ketobacter alkanivorans TaxID=1917421 RepID=A0A2K9LKX7_9GAMM|nr:hypothetical protein [Ketobacter alkanivorans]AUM12932.1 hypothetical protein Kalk_11080 [Ketobacter alkanivorans]